MPICRSILKSLGGIFLAVLVIASLYTPSEAQLNQIETDHFRILYRTGTEGTARRVAEVAEEVFEPMASAFNFYDDFSNRIYILIMDNTDNSNGYADYNAGVIGIWATGMDIELRGTHRWIRHVLTHELAHILSLRKARKSWPFRFALLRWQISDKNPDVNLSLPIYHLATPGWLVEGIAQFEDYKIGYDSWDTHRDMLLRMATLEDDLLSYDEMGVLYKDGLHWEMIYNQGYSFLLYIHERFGEGKVEELVENVGILNFNSSIRKVTGMSPGDLYRDWKRSLEKKYGEAARKVQTSEREGEKIIDGGYLDYFPKYSPDSKKIAYLSNEGEDFRILKLKVFDLETGKDKVIMDKRVNGGFSWSPDGVKLIYTRLKNSGYHDIFIYDLELQEERRISARLRAKYPAISPDGSKIAFVNNKDGTNNLGLMDVDGKNIEFLTHNNDGTQYYSPQWSPDGKKIAFSVFRGEDRDIAIIDAHAPTFSKKEAKKDGTSFPDSVAYSDSSGFEAIINSTADERDPCWLPDGSGLIYSSDQDGTFNIYEYSLESGEVQKISNVVGGAFCPSITGDGVEIVYAGYHAADYSIYRLQRDGYEEETDISYVADRDYQSIFNGEKLSKEYNIGKYRGDLFLSSFVPILTISQPFIGGDFSPRQLTGGLFASVGDVIGRDFVSGLVTVGKNLQEGSDINTDFRISYRMGLPRVRSERKAFDPSPFIFFRHLTLNRLIQSSVPPDTLARVSPWPFPIGTDDPDSSVFIPDASGVVVSPLQGDFTFKNKYRIFFIGSDFRITGRQSLSVGFSNWRFSERRRDVDFVRVVEPHILRTDTAGRVENITGRLSATARHDLTHQMADLFEVSESTVDTTINFDDINIYGAKEDLAYFKSNDFTVSWRYFKRNPKKDFLINPTGRSIQLSYTRMQSTVADSLITLNSVDGRAVDILGSDETKLGINQYILSWNERIGLPGRTTFSLWSRIRYRGKEIKQPPDDGNRLEGVFFWPLRFYLGGWGSLRGYPYFTLEGAQDFFTRASFTFPVFQNMKTHFWNMHFDKLYATFFFDTGASWNFEKFDELMDSIRSEDFLTDVGLEINIQMFTFYRLPLRAFFMVARPLRIDRAKRVISQTDGTPINLIEIDRYRYLFGINFF